MMKVYVWDSVLWDYTPGFMFAIANSVDEARAQLLQKDSCIPEEDIAQEPRELDLSEPVAFVLWGGA